MDKEKIGSVKNYIDSLNKKIKSMKNVMKEGDSEGFEELKKESIELTKKIEENTK